MASLDRFGFEVMCVEEEGVWLYEELPAVVSVDKKVIAPSGDDIAIVTAEVPEGVTEITFYRADTGEKIATQLVDPTTHKATLQIASTLPGATIHIRAGELTKTRRYNEVVIKVNEN